MLKHLLYAACAACLLSGCATDLAGNGSDLTTVSLPSGMAIHPNGRYAYVVGSNFDLDYRATDGGALYVVDLENNVVLPTSKRIGSFGTNVVLSGDDPQKPTRGYLVTREDDALVWFEISKDGSSIYCPNDPNSSSLLKCRIILEDDPTHVSVTRSHRDVYDSNGIRKGRVNFDLLMIAQLRNSYVTAMTVVTPTASDPDYSFSYETASLVYSASETQWFNGEQFFVTGRAATDLALVEPILDQDASVLGLHVRSRLSVPFAPNAGGYQGRGMALDPTRQRLFLLNQYPKSIFRFNTGSLLGNDTSIETAQVVAEEILPEAMSKVAWVGDTPDGVLYLTSVTDDTLYLVDPKSLEILKTVPTGKGPYEIVVQNDKHQVYVLNFTGGDIWLYDTTDPLNPVLKQTFLSKNDGNEAAPDQE